MFINSDSLAAGSWKRVCSAELISIVETDEAGFKQDGTTNFHNTHVVR
jgi:hypothetical protein